MNGAARRIADRQYTQEEARAYRMCTRKCRYPSKAKASVAAVRRRVASGQRISPYSCLIDGCEGWHMGHSDWMGALEKMDTVEFEVGNLRCTSGRVIRYLASDYEITHEQAADLLITEPYQTELANGIQWGSLTHYVANKIAQHAMLILRDVPGEVTL